MEIITTTGKMKQKNILIVLAAQNFSQEEYTVVKHVFGKNCFKAFIASDTDGVCIGQEGLKVKPDISLLNVQQANFAALVLIGGAGIGAYFQNAQLHKIISAFNSRNKTIAAICMAPAILGEMGLLKGKKATCYDTVTKRLIQRGAEFSDYPVVVSDNIITARDPLSAQEFAETIINRIR